MLRLLASRLLKKRLLAAWKAARKMGKVNLRRAKKRRQSPERSCLPTAATLPSGDFGTSPPKTRPRPNRGRPSDESTAYLSPTGVAKSKDRCHLSNAASCIASVHDVSGRSARLPTAARQRLRGDHAQTRRRPTSMIQLS